MLNIKLKTSILFFTVFYCCFDAQALDQSYLRQVGTNLYDFSPLVLAPNQESYRVVGQVTKIFPQSIQVTRHIKQVVGITFQYRGPSAGKLSRATTSDMLKMLYASSVASGGEMSLGKYLSMGPEERQNFIPVQKVEEKTEIFYLLNYPSDVVLGSQIDCFAVPTSSRGFWDFGKPFSGDVSQFKTVYHISSAGFTTEHHYSPEEKKTMKAAIDAKVIAFQEQQASNGMAYSQFDLGIRYFKGNGVESNKSTALQWIRKSAEQDYAPAIQFLATNEVSRIAP
jgi:hypothetical protein